MTKRIYWREFPDIIRRRARYFIFPFLIVIIVSTLGAYLLPERYESYTTILLQKDEILNPLVSMQWAVSLVQADRLTTFNEILYSRTTLMILLDSLGLLTPTKSEERLSEMITSVRTRISTTQRGSDSFRITVVDKDPVIAQKSATLLSRIYIQTSLKSTQQQNEDAVKFFEDKVREYGAVFQEQQRELLSAKRGKVSALPQSELAYNTQLDYAEAELNDARKMLGQQLRIKNLIRNYIENIDNPETISQISALETLGAVIYINELKSLSLKYNELITRFTPRYPEVQMVRSQMLNLLTKAEEALAADIEITRARENRITGRRQEILQNINRAISFSEVSDERKAAYNMTKEFYEEMKTKLEQARVSRDLGERGEAKYVILDPAQVPTKPSKPNRGLIITAGVGIGFIIGLISMFLVEFLDPTIRHRQDIEVFQKPIVAYLP